MPETLRKPDRIILNPLVHLRKVSLSVYSVLYVCLPVCLSVSPVCLLILLPEALHKPSHTLLSPSVHLRKLVYASVFSFACLPVCPFIMSVS